MWPYSDKAGNLKVEPIRVNIGKNELVCNIACGHNFAVIQTKNGSLYSYGKTNKFGQLGHGDNNPRYRPFLIEFFTINQERVAQVSCGYKHCVAKTNTGKVFTWGLVS